MPVSFTTDVNPVTLLAVGTAIVAVIRFSLHPSHAAEEARREAEACLKCAKDAHLRIELLQAAIHAREVTQAERLMPREVENRLAQSIERLGDCLNNLFREMITLAEGQPLRLQGRVRFSVFRGTRASGQGSLGDIHAVFSRMTAFSRMRWLLVGVAFLGILGAPRAELRITSRPCLSPREMQDVVATHKVVSPALAVGLARRAVPGADMLRAMLCSDGDVYLYVISVLRKDGRVVHVVVDGPSGKVAAVQ